LILTTKNRSVVFTRGFHVKVDRNAEYEITVLVPFADIMNRVHEDQVKFFFV